MQLKARIERLSNIFMPEKTKVSGEYSAEEWISAFNRIKEEHSPIIKYMLERFIRELNGRNYSDVMKADKKIRDFMAYIFGYIREESLLDINRMPYDQIKGIDKIIDIILSGEWVTFAHDCGDCDCKIPVRVNGNKHSDRVIFEKCPVCSGNTGYALYYYTHQKQYEEWRRTPRNAS